MAADGGNSDGPCESKTNEVVAFPIVHSEEEAYRMYCEYAHKLGFSVRKQHIVYWTHTRIVKSREYSCSKAGLKRSSMVTEDPKMYRRLDTRTGCLACLHFSADTEGRNWTVVKFIEEHNHELAVKSESHMLRSNRKISKVQASVLQNMTSAGIRTVDAFNFLAEEVGGFDNVGFGKKDAYNYVQRERQALIESGDAASLLMLLKKRQNEDNMFSFDVQTDEYNRLTSFIWMDGHSKIEYDSFGDVLIFDTIFKLNKYNLACAPFIVVNHHWQNVFIGGAFIAAETINSFYWVFEALMRFVGNK